MKKADLLKKCKDLGINTEGLTKNAKGEVTNATLKAAIAAVEAKKDNDANNTAADFIEVQDPTGANKAIFEVNERVYTFSKRCPNTVQMDGEIYSKKQLLTKKELLERLVLGNSPFVTPF